MSEPNRQQLRHKKCNHLLALAKDGGIELACNCKEKVVVDIAVLEALIEAAKAGRSLEINV